MKEINVPNSDDVYYYVKNHFARWNDRYNRTTMALEQEEEFENVELNKYTSRKRDSFYMQHYYNELDEYYTYIEKTLLELQAQKRWNTWI